MAKAQSTRDRIVDAAARTASLNGVESLTIGTLAQALNMSKSGLFAHFGSREFLQIATIDHVVRQFTDEVYKPASMLPPGQRQVLALVRNWFDWMESDARPGGCPLAAAAFEFDSQPGEVSERVAATFDLWRKTLVKAIDAGKSTDIAKDCDAEAITFEIFGLYFAEHLYRWLLGRCHSDVQALQRIERKLAGQQGVV